MTFPARRPWWKKKRWQTAVAVSSLLAAYPACLAPVGYGVGRRWIPAPLADAYLWPIDATLGPSERTAVGRASAAYGGWGYDLGRRHAASD